MKLQPGHIKALRMLANEAHAQSGSAYVQIGADTLAALLAELEQHAPAVAALTAERDELFSEVLRLRAALVEATMSLRTISNQAGRAYMDDMLSVRAYARSREQVAHAALAPRANGGG